MQKIGVIGGGPAGILAAGSAASENTEVVLIEKNEKLGKKMFITGKGRCNITNAAPIEDFFDKIMSNHFFMYSSLYSFDNNSIISLLETYGLESKVERGNRVFPKSDKSSDVIKSLEYFLAAKKVRVKLNCQVQQIKKDQDKFILETNQGQKEFDKIIIATGGFSYQATGSTGDGYQFAKDLGHTLTDLKPALVPINLKDHWLKDVQGLSLRNVELRIFVGDRKIVEEFGDLMFTHFGISGPIALKASSQINRYNHPLTLTIDLKPALTDEQVDKRILRDFEKYKNKQFKNGLNDLLPKALIPVFIKMVGIDKDKKINQITKEERKILVHTIKNFPLTYKGLRSIDYAIVTAGGVSVHEVNSSTMESKLVEGLYFAGEIMDVDALTGGYNLQMAYAMGHLAGVSASKKGQE